MKLTKTHLKQIIKEELQGVLKEQGPAVPLLKTYSAAKAWAQGTKATKLAGETALSTSSAATNAEEEDYLGMSLDAASIAPGPQQPFVIAAATTYAVGKWFNKLNKKQQDTFRKLNSRFNGKKSRNAALQSWRRANGLRPDGTCCLNRKKFPPVKSAAEVRGHWQPSIADMSIDSKEQKALANWFSQDKE
jgi:hypothetical protein